MLQNRVRGQDILVDAQNKKVYTTIKKPHNGMISINDKIFDMTTLGGGSYRIMVKVESYGTRIEINSKTPVVKTETIPSKWGGNDWSRYWFDVPAPKAREERKDLV